MFFALYDSWRRAQILRKNVSSDALKLFHSAAEKAGGAAPEKGVGPTTAAAATAANSGSTPFTSPTPANPPSTSSPFSWGNPKGTGSLLDRLLQVRSGLVCVVLLRALCGSALQVYSKSCLLLAPKLPFSFLHFLHYLTSALNCLWTVLLSFHVCD